jgi:hypothetical protein
MDEKDLIDFLFTYHPPSEGDKDRFDRLTAAAKAFALVILEVCPASADRSAAVRKVREARMTANSSIACKGRG